MLFCSIVAEFFPATVQNGAASTRFYNLNFANSHGAGESALALSATGTQQGYYGCQFIGNESPSSVPIVPVLN
jgi:hypothetical protein